MAGDGHRKEFLMDVFGLLGGITGAVIAIWVLWSLPGWLVALAKRIGAYRV